MNGGPISRRRALGLLSLGGAAVAIGTAGWLSASGVFSGRTPLPPGPSGEPLRQPDVLASRDGVLAVSLTAAAGVRLAGRDSSAYGFNGTSPGPTLRVRPGETLRIRLANQINQPTNLHTHGLHVSPQGAGDNPFLSIAPGASFDYEITMPANHPAGTHWYHPHHHGSVADQIFGGLVGALLVDGEHEPPVSDDLVLLVTDTTLDRSGRVAPASPMAKMMGREGDWVLVNGQHQPVIRAAAGTMHRWRVINGCVSRFLALRLDNHQLTQIAQDGAYLPAPAEPARVVLAPGNRADLLVSPMQEGRYALVSEPYDRGNPTMMGGRMAGGTGPTTLLTLAVAGTATVRPHLPAALPAPTVATGPTTGQRRLTLSMGMMGMGMGGMSFTIDGRTFDPDRDDQVAQLGTIEEWTVVNTSPMVHPFHLHAWPFQILTSSTGPAPMGSRHDVAIVPAQGWVRLRIPFDHPGRSVYHCHILDHEDLGMMGTVNVRVQ